MPRLLRHEYAPRAGLSRALLGALILCVVVQVDAQDGITVTWGPEHSLRALAATYLQDPDAWPEILHANGLESAHQLRPGRRLLIPAPAALRLAGALEELRSLLYRANEAGAQVFAPEEITRANALHADTLQARTRGSWDEATRAAERGVEAARRALEIALRNRDMPAQAVLEHARGKVQRRRPTEFDWTTVEVRALLAEQERLRTLSRSFALVRFRDASSLQLEENAQLAIQRIRHDLLTRSEQVDVILYGGGLRALLDPQGARQSLQVQVPGVETRGHSNNYWVKTTHETTRLANYDGEIEVSARGGSVIVRKNQGTRVKPHAPPENPKDLLPAPVLRLPKEGETIYRTDVRLSWEANKKARHHWLEVARDPRFERLVLNVTAIEGNKHELRLAEEGIYYWRVSAVDAAGLPGPPSAERHFLLRLDTEAPFLQVDTPTDGQQVSEGLVTLTGRTEPGASMRIDAAPLTVDADGRFSAELRLVEGTNSVLLEARDPAGNVRAATRNLVYAPEADWFLHIADGMARDEQGRLVVAGPRRSLDGTTLAHTSLRVTTPDIPNFEASTVADEAGRFSFTLPAADNISELVIHAEGPAGQQEERHLAVVLDIDPPVIHLNAAPPMRTADPTLSLRGQIEGGVELSYAVGARAAEAAVLLPDGRFDVDTPLDSGANPLLLVAHDLAGNRTEWRGRIVLDREPPALLGHRLSRHAPTTGQTLVVEIRANDPSGVKAGIPYQLRLGHSIYRGIAGRCADGDCHRDIIALPTEDAGQARLISVTLQDYLGNREEIRFD